MGSAMVGTFKPIPDCGYRILININEFSLTTQ